MWRRRIVWGLLALLALFVVVAAGPALLPNFGRNRGLALGEERPPASEAQAIAQVVASIERIIRGLYPDGVRPARRDAHAKAQGCVQARFTVEPDLPPELALGLFARPASYQAWVRFSSSDRKPQPDLVPDGRGMAIKLLGVAGAKLLDDEREATTHDFVMINHPVFFVRDAADYVDFTDAEERGQRWRFFFGPRLPTRWRLHEALTGYRITHHPASSPLEQRYFSMTPYRLGTAAIKFAARPCGEQATPVSTSGDDALRALLVDQLARGGGCFLFQVQLQKDAHDMPVEDPTIEWDEKASPYRTVARLEIPSQAFASPEQLTACENLSFTPWHALPAHQPLGGINRVRRAAYQAISVLRHQLNDVPRREP